MNRFSNDCGINFNVWCPLLVQQECGGRWVELEAQLMMRGGAVVGTTGPTGHALLLDCRFEPPFGKSTVHASCCGQLCPPICLYKIKYCFCWVVCLERQTILHYLLSLIEISESTFING